MPTGTPQSRPFLLLTGATGLVGGLVLALLLRCNLPVAVLVRGTRRQSAAERMEALMLRLEERFNRTFVRPVVLSGDLCSPGLGLSDSDRRWIAANCGSVIHSAANLLFRPASTHPDNEPYRTNVDGTKRLLELTTEARICEWHYVSTAYIAGLRSDRILESQSDVGQEFGNDYERSKTISEQMLRQSAAIHSLTVYRPSIVIDLHPTTSMRSDQTINSAFAMFQALSQRFGLPDRGDWFRRLGFSGHERKNIVTVDWVASMIAQIYRRPALHNQTYHLTSPAGTAAAELEDGFRAAVLESGIKLPARRAEATALIDEQAAPFVAAFKPYFRDDPIFDRTNTVHAMAVCAEPDLPTLSVDNLRDFCMRQTRPSGPPVNVKEAESPWTDFVRSRTLTSSPHVLPASGSSSVLGLELYGASGGQWLIEQCSNGPTVYAASASLSRLRVVSSSATFHCLLSGQLSIKSALNSGLVQLEMEDPGSTSLRNSSTSAEDWLVNQLTQLISQVQQHSSSQPNFREEVANVG